MSAVSTRPVAAPEIHITPPSARMRLDLREYYRYRHMLKALIWRNVRVQFDEMALGFVWAWVRPLLYVVVFVAFRRFSNANPHVTIPYPLYVFSGLVLWYYFLESMMQTAGALRSDAHLLTKVYYPRLITPMVPSLANLFGLGLSAIPMIVMMVWYGVFPGWRIVLLPAVLLQCVALTVGVGAVFASLTLTSRDWERLLGSILYLGLFVSPVIYSPDMIPEGARVIYALNPMAGTLLAFRSTVFGPEPFPWGQWTYAGLFSLVVVLIGVRVFRAAEAGFADRL